MVVMSLKVVFPRCLALWAALGVAVAQPHRVSQGAQAPAGGAGSRAVELNREGNASVGSKQYEQAKALFKQAIQLDPKLSDAYENLALILLLDGNDAAAEHTALELLALAPGNYNGRLVAGVAALNRNNFSRGWEYLTPLIRSGADDPLVTAAYATALAGSGRKTEAERFSSRVAKLQVEPPDALLAGQIFRQPKLKAIAQTWMEACVTNRALRSTPISSICLPGCTPRGPPGRCLRTIRPDAEVSPGNVDALVELSELERRLGQRDKAVSHLYAAKTLAANDPATLLHFSQACLHRRMDVDASDALKKVVSQDPRNRHAWYQLGLSQFRLGETEAAEKDFRAA